VLVFGFVIFLVTSSNGETASLRARLSSKAASSILSPPSLPFYSSSEPLEAQPPPPVVHYYLNNVTTSEDPIGNEESVLILTPLSRFYDGYWNNLLSLSYPHELISLGFITPKDSAGNAATKQLQEAIALTQSSTAAQRFKSITILRQDFDPPLTSQSESERHKMENQKIRRAAMAKARNSLLFTTIGPATSWVLWLDSDIVETPPSLIQDLASHNKPIIVPNCFQRYYDDNKKAMDVRPYDFNSWIDSPNAQDLAKAMGKDDILLEGYAEMATYRSLMAYMPQGSDTDSHQEVQLDGVGGTALLVKAEVHRDGAMFPPFAFYHLIETEGFAKMASRLGWKSYGLPNYYVSPLTSSSNPIQSNQVTGLSL
jgi:mannan polymerase complexes MNN9 subunit